MCAAEWVPDAEGFHTIAGERWNLLLLSHHYVQSCGLDKRWYLDALDGVDAGQLKPVMDIALKDGEWWLLGPYVTGKDAFDLLGPYDTEDDARTVTMMMLSEMGAIKD